MLDDVVVVRGREGAVVDEVGGAAAERLGAGREDEVVAAGGEDGDGDARALEIGRGGEFVAEEEADGEPAIMVRSDRSERIVGRDQDRAGERPFSGEARGDAAADAEADRDDARGPVAAHNLVEQGGASASKAAAEGLPLLGR